MAAHVGLLHIFVNNDVSKLNANIIVDKITHTFLKFVLKIPEAHNYHFKCKL